MALRLARTGQSAWRKRMRKKKTKMKMTFSRFPCFIKCEHTDYIFKQQTFRHTIYSDLESLNIWIFFLFMKWNRIFYKRMYRIFIITSIQFQYIISTTNENCSFQVITWNIPLMPLMFKNWFSLGNLYFPCPLKVFWESWVMNRLVWGLGLN